MLGGFRIVTACVEAGFGIWRGFRDLCGNRGFDGRGFRNATLPVARVFRGNPPFFMLNLNLARGSWCADLLITRIDLPLLPSDSGPASFVTPLASINTAKISICLPPSQYC
jgi:hypothetical protein